MSRPSHIPIRRLANLRVCHRVSAWRYAKAGVLGAITKDQRGWPQVSVGVVERFFNTTFTDEELIRAASVTVRDASLDRKKIEKLRSLIPPPLTVDAGDVQFLSKFEAETFARNLLAARDRQYGEVLAKLLRIPTRNPHVATARRSRRIIPGYVSNKSRSAADDVLPELHGGSNV